MFVVPRFVIQYLMFVVPRFGFQGSGRKLESRPGSSCSSIQELNEPSDSSLSISSFSSSSAKIYRTSNQESKRQKQGSFSFFLNYARFELQIKVILDPIIAPAHLVSSNSELSYYVRVLHRSFSIGRVKYCLTQNFGDVDRMNL